MFESTQKEQQEAEHEEQTPSEENVIFELYEDLSLAYIKINSFSYEYLNSDKSHFKKFFKRINRYKNLVIDIQGNSGGDDIYWQKYIVGNLINGKIKYPYRLAFKKKLLDSAYDHYQSNSTIEELNFK